MKQTLLGEPVKDYARKLKREIFVCCAAAVGLLWANIAACCLRTDENHGFLLCFNILTDILGGGAILFWIENRIQVKRKMLRLAKRPVRQFAATVEEISQQTHRIPGLDCSLVRADGRVLYLPQTDTLRLEQNVSYTFGIVDNVIVEVEA